MAKYVINTASQMGTINKNIYGHFSEHLGRCIYEGLYVGQNSNIPNTNGMRKDVISALKNIKVPVLRWPGGCFADEYHWKDGIGPKENRKKMINTHWGGVVEDNSFGTHEFMELCSQIGCEPYINGNVGSGTVQEMSEWMEYLTFDGLSPMALLREKNGRKEPWKVKFFGVGNENWGCGGNMRPSFYADLYRQFQTYVRNYGDNKVFKIACGPGCSRENPNYKWFETVLEIAADKMNGISLHYYTVPGTWENKGSATAFTLEDWYRTLNRALFVDELLINAKCILDRHDKQRKIGIIFDEWGTWFTAEPGTNPGFLYQQNTMRDALVAAVTLDIFNKHNDRVTMANIAQTINVLQAVILTEGSKMVLTPTYHVFDLYKVHQNATRVDSFMEIKEIGTGDNKVPNLSGTASIDETSTLHITVSNLSADESFPICCDISGMPIKSVSAKILTQSMMAYNDFDNAENVIIKDFTGIQKSETGLSFTIPPCSVMQVTVR